MKSIAIAIASMFAASVAFAQAPAAPAKKEDPKAAAPAKKDEKKEEKKDAKKDEKKDAKK